MPRLIPEWSVLTRPHRARAFAARRPAAHRARRKGSSRRWPAGNPPWHATLHEQGSLDRAITEATDDAGTKCVRDATATAVLGTALAAGVAAVVGVAQSSPAILVAAATALGSLPAMLTAVGMLRRTPRTSTPADRVSLSRAVLASGCAAVSTMAVADAVSVRTWWFVLLAATTLLLDAVDGAVARATGTASAAGARLDMELDAGVLVVLSIAAATVLGWWVLLIAAMRYLYLGASFLWPVLDTPLPTSQFRRTVAALQGGALVVALAPVVPIGVAGIAVLVALVLLLTSFAQQAVLATRPERAADISTGAERSTLGIRYVGLRPW